MKTDRSPQEDAALRQRGRRLVWIAVGAAVAALLTALAPERGSDEAPRTALRLLLEPASAPPQRMASRSVEVDWDAVEAAPDPAPLSVAAYDR